METVRSTDELRYWVESWRLENRSVGFVPTMGALHEGHLTLVRHASQLADRVVVSIFVNPTQFGPGEDFESYPRDADQDSEMLQESGCHLLFLPETSTLYPEGHSTYVEVATPAERLEGEFRPGHFRGVATVVTQLLNLVRPDVAVFGQKDAQQLAVVRRLARDLHLPVEIASHPTVREPDGLAMSSRNAYLSADERTAAAAIYRALSTARQRIEDGERSAEAIRRVLREVLEQEPLIDIEYAEVVDTDTFEPILRLRGNIVMPIAARIGATRLIDNIPLEVD
ncbi:MAG: pantoate--beta-alanine ligase [Thermoanaerobaculia bacterium]